MARHGYATAVVATLLAHGPTAAAPVTALQTSTYVAAFAKATAATDLSIHSNQFQPADPLASFRTSAAIESVDLQQPALRAAMAIDLQVDAHDATSGQLGLDLAWSANQLSSGYLGVQSLSSVLKPAWTYRFHADQAGVFTVNWDAFVDIGALNWSPRLFASLDATRVELGMGDDQTMSFAFGAGDHEVSFSLFGGVSGGIGTVDGKLRSDLDWSIRFTDTPTAVPEPAPAALLAAALLGLALTRRRPAVH